MRCEMELFFVGRRDPIRFRFSWETASTVDVPSPSDVTMKLAEIGTLTTEDRALVSWDPDLVEFASVKAIAEEPKRTR